jgi:S1-C subfamily serine protease
VDARHFGLDAETARRIELESDGKRRVLAVARVAAGTPAARALQVGDLLLSLDGRPVRDYAEVEAAAHAPRVSLVTLRHGQLREVALETTPLDGGGTDRCLLWAGALLQPPHRPLPAQRGIAPTGVYVSWLWYGSPANRHGLAATRRILAVDGVPVPDLDAFLAAVQGRPDRSAVRLNTRDLDGREEVITLELDLQFWPTIELRRGADGWQRIEH